MKKFFTLAFAALLAVGAFAQTSNALMRIWAGGQPALVLNINNIDSITFEETVTPPSGVTFSFNISNLTASTATVTVTPSDTNVYYYFDVLSRADYAEYSSDADLVADYLTYFQQVIDEYAQQGTTVTIYDFLSKSVDSYNFTRLSASTDYFAFAFQLDPVALTLVGSIQKVSFTTPAAAQSSLSFTTQANDTAIFFIPSDTTAQFFAAFAEADSLRAWGYTADSFIDAYINYYVSQYGSYVIPYLLSTGTIYIPFSDLEPRVNYMLIAKEYVNGAFAGNAVVVNFTLPTSAPARRAMGQLKRSMTKEKAVKKAVRFDPQLIRK